MDPILPHVSHAAGPQHQYPSGTPPRRRGSRQKCRLRNQWTSSCQQSGLTRPNQLAKEMVIFHSPVSSNVAEAENSATPILTPHISANVRDMPETAACPFSSNLQFFNLAVPEAVIDASAAPSKKTRYSTSGKSDRNIFTPPGSGCLHTEHQLDDH